MRQIVLLFVNVFAFLVVVAQSPLPQQMPPYFINNLSVNATNGIDLYQSETIISTGNESQPVNISGTAKVDYKASKEVELKPGFTASDFTGDGEFHAYIDELPFEVAWFEPVQNVGTVPKYEKLELGIKLPQEIQDNIDDFLNDQTYPILPSGDQINPYDPEQISVEINLTSPDNRNITKYGFYYKEFRVDPVSSYTQNAETFSTFWFDDGSEYTFRIRFAPDYIGEWTYSINILLDETNTVGVYSGSFSCVTSDNKGYLEVSDNNRYLRFKDNHESFFAIGENLAFPFYNYMLTPEHNAQELMTQLSGHDGNYFRLWMAPWQLGVERERLGVYDKGESASLWWQPYGGEVDRQYHAWELDKIINQARENDLYIQLCLEGNSLSNNPDISWLSSGWDENPYLNINDVDVLYDFFSNSEAQGYYMRRLRYIISRWGYSTNIAMYEFFNELDLQFNLPNTGVFTEPQSIAAGLWHTEMADYIRNDLNDNHLLATSFGGDAHYYDGLNLVSKHGYSWDRDHIYNNLAPSVNNIIETNTKPLIIGELGQTHGGYNQIEECNPISFHNTIWATSFTGSIGTYIPWHWDITHREDREYYNHFQPLAGFMAGVDFEWNNFVPKRDATEDVEMFYLINNDGEDASQAMGWIHNRSAYWANVENVDGPTNCFYEYDDDQYTCPGDDIDCIEFENHIYDLGASMIAVEWLESCGEDCYTVQWYNTSTGEEEGTADFVTEFFGYFLFDVPAMPAEGGPYDWAFKIQPEGEAFRSLSSGNNETDTFTFCMRDSAGILKAVSDTLNYTITGITYMPENSQRTYYINRDELFKKQGFYGINYTDFFTREPIDKKTLFLVKNCEMEDHRLQKLIAGKTQYTNENGIAHRCDISVNPNPTTGFATITIKGIDYVNSFFSVYDINGQLVIPDSPVQSFSFKFDISYLPTGIYTMRLKTNRSIYNTKIVKL